MRQLFTVVVVLTMTKVTVWNNELKAGRIIGPTQDGVIKQAIPPVGRIIYK